jgi:uncharacterized protein (DUF885 family)
MATFAGMVDEFLQEQWQESPLLASALGVEGYDDRVDDFSREAIERRQQRDDHWLQCFESIEAGSLSFSEQLDRDLLLTSLRGERIMRDWRGWQRQPAMYLSPGLSGVFSLFLHRLHPEPHLARAAAARLRAVPGVLAQGRRNLDPELVPSLFAERALGQARAGIRYARDLVPAEVQDAALRADLAAAGEVAATAFEEFAAFLTDLRERARGAWAIGEARYSRLLREKELLGYGAAELRERGRVEWDRIAEELRRCAQQIAATDDWVHVLEDLNKDHPPTPEAMRATYADWTERARQFLKERRLVTFPAGEACAVEPSPPFQRPILAVASYSQPPAFSPSLQGHFFVPFPPDGVSEADIQQRLESNSYANIPTIAVHEAYPGHHWHLVTSKANPSRVRQVFRTPYFSEGWGLYAERVMREQGFFTDPRHEMFQYEATLFRAARIVVDTSLHMGEMGVEEAVRFKMERGNLPEPTARAEVGRYCTMPTQASSYLTGCLEILRIRDRFMQEKGLSGIDGLRRFHDTIAGSGSLPIALAERAALA